MTDTDWSVTCWNCRKEFSIGGGWSAAEKESIPCPHCDVPCKVFVDEDRDCNYWFEAEKPS